MDADKILSVQLIDIVFDGRNKDYGAYVLRRNYPGRLMTALLVTFAVIAVAVVLISLRSKTQVAVDRPVYKIRDGHILENPPPIEAKKPIVKPNQKAPLKPQPLVKSVIFTKPVIVNKEILDKPITPIADLRNRVIDVKTTEGIPTDGKVVIESPVKGTGMVRGIIETNDDGPPFKVVEVPAKFVGNWMNFLLKNLNANVPVDNGAPSGTYSVIIQFVVDKEGNVSEVKALTAHGYGLEQEAIRVIKKATRWEAAIQNGFKVKAYHRQVITFNVEE